MKKDCFVDRIKCGCIVFPYALSKKGIVMSNFCSAISLLVLGVVVCVVFVFVPEHIAVQKIVKLDSAITYLNQHAPQFQENYQEFLDAEGHRNRIYLDKWGIRNNGQVLLQLQLCKYVVNYAEWTKEGVIGTKTLSSAAFTAITSPEYKFFCAL